MEDNRTVIEYYDDKYGKKKKKKSVGERIKGKVMEVVTKPFRKIEKSMEERTGGKSMRKKKYPEEE